MEREGDADANFNECAWNSLQRLEKETGIIENWRKYRDYQDYNIIKIGLNSEKSSEDLKILAVT